MKKINSKKSILSAVFCLALATTIAPSAYSYDLGTEASRLNNTIYGNQTHDTDFLKDRYQQRQQNEDYGQYQQRKRLDANPNEGNQVIQNTNPNNATCAFNQ